MQTLWFFKAQHKKECAQVVFLITADTEEDAVAKGFNGISPNYRENYKLAECTAVCQTPDTVNIFEPC